MKDKFQSLVGMRGACGWLNDPLITHLSPTNHPLKHGIGKYIFSFLLVLTMSIGNVWADVVISLQGTTAAPSKKAAQVGTMDAYFGRCGNAVSLTSDGLTTGNSTIFAAFKVAARSEIVLTCYCTASSNYTKDEYLSTVTWSNITNMVTTEVNSTPAKAYFETDYETFTITYNKDTQKNKEYEISLGEYAAGDYAIYMKNSINSAFYIRKITLKPSCDAPTTAFSEGAYTVGESALALSSLISGNNSDGAISYVVKTDGGTGANIAAGSFTATAAGTATITATQAADATHNKCEKIIDFNVVVTASSCAATIPGDISKGALTAGEITLTADGSAESGDIWYWQDAADGTATNLGTGATKNVNTAGTYYIRSYNAGGDCWSAAKSIEVTAEELLEHYAITYNKGAYGTGEIAGGEKVEGVAFTLSSDRFTRAGYVQVGWALTNGGAKAYDLGGSYTTDAAQEFFPVWAETSTYVASFACGATAPAGWTFSNAGTYGDTDATADYVCNFVTAGTSTPKQDPAEGKDGTTDNDVAFAKNTNAIATYDLGAATTVTALNVTLCGGSGSAFNETIEYLGADGSTVKKTYINSLSAGNWNDNLISKNEIVEDVRYIRVHGASKWVAMKAFSVTYVDLVTKYNVSFDKNGGSGADMATLKYAENAVVTLPSCSFTPPDDHVFDGWAVTKTASGDPITVTDGKFTMPAEAVTATAQWATISDFDVKFFQGYGDPDVQIGATQVISTGEYATAPTDPERAGFAFLGWSYDATEAHIVDVATYGITAATNFTAMWKAVWTVTFDGAGNVEVQDGETVASPDSPTQAGKIFQGWYNGESKYDFSAAVTEDLTLESKWTTADANHYYYNYKDDFHFDGVVYKTPEGKVDEGAGASNIAITTPYTLFSGAEGITSIVATKAIYDSKSNWVNAYLKINTSEDSYLTFTIASGYTAVLKMKMGGYSQNPTVTLKKGEDVVDATSGTIGGVASTENNYNEITYNLVAGTYTMTTTVKTLYISHIDLEATALPTHSVTYKPGDGEGAWVVDADATEVADCPGTFTAPTGKVFNGWKNESDDSDVAVGAIVEDDMNLIAQWINVYAVTFNMNGHGDAIDPQDIKEGAKATRPDDPVEIGYDFGGWFTDNGTFEAPFDFNTPIIAATPLYAKWTADPCPDKKSIVKAVMATNTTATVTGYNSNEYAGGYIVNNLADDASNTNMYDFGEGEVKGFKLKGSNSAIFATLSKGGFEVGDQVVFAVTKNAGDNKLAIYAAKDKDHVLKLVELDVDAAGIYTYRLTQDNIDAIEAAGSDYLSIGTFRGDYNPYIYSVELKGCRSWAIFHTLTFKNIDGTATIAAKPLEEGAYASTIAPVAPKIAMKRFLGWAEATDGTPVDLTTYTITEDKILYAVYEDIVCPTSGTVYKFEIKDELPYENLPTSTDKDMSSYITATGDGYLTYTATANNKATINSDGTIQMKDASAAYLKVELECALAAGDQIRAHVTNNPMRVQVGTTYDSNKDLILAKNAYEFVAITSAMEGKQVLYITRSSNGNANLADFEIYRPAKYDVTFNMMGHGTQIADIEDVIEGSKITAPTAPTDANYSFAGWYKENTLANEWKFDVDVVEANTTLYAKWLDKSDATLKSLKYGETEIALEVGVYTYNVSLPAFTSAVPALTAETSNPSATKVIANAAAFDSEGNAASTVTVTPEVGADQVYTVNFAKGVEILLQDVTGSITWNFANAVSANVSITGTPQVLANYAGVTNDNTFESDKLEASGEKFTAGSNANLRANYIRFHTTVPGKLSISYSNTGGSNPARYIYVNGVKYDEEGSANTTPKGADSKVFVPAGDVELVMKDGEDASKNVQIYQMIFNATPDYTRDVTEGRYGTICLPKAGVMVGATLYEIAYYGATSEKIFFDDIPTGEMEAGVPYVFLPNEGVSELGVYYTADVVEPAGTYYTDGTTPASTSKNGLVGFIGAAEDDYFDIPDGDGNYIIQNNQYREIPAGAWARVKSNRAYIHFAGIPRTEPALAPGRKRMSIGAAAPQITTGMDELNAAEAPVKVLINGELFILRGEKMYDATGRLVK